MTTMMVTGATDGIGTETARQLAQRGARVLVHGRTEAKARAAVGKLQGAGALEAVWGDLGSLAQVRALAQQVRALTPTLDALVNNAGVFMNEQALTEDGFELTFAVNHLAPVLLTHELLPLLEAARGRVVNVSSVAHTRGQVDEADLPVPRRFTGSGAYAASKLLNVLFTHELARRLGARGSEVVAFALHPGVITTKLLRTGFNTTGASVEAGARTSVFCATSAEVGGSGSYYSGAREVAPAAHALDPALERRLYERSCALVGCRPL
jgi:NAD(P)-dependent dehydrogenase (short-subunit alcohol dehydrogenase family)